MATVASSNFTTLAYIAEVADEMPSSGEMRYIPFTGESLQFSKESISSNNINPSRQISDQIQTGFEVSGGVQIELGPKAFDDFIEAGMWEEWGVATDVVVQVTIATAGTITASAGTPFAQLVAGQFFKMAETTSNDGIYQIDTVSDTVITVKDTYDLVNETDTADVTIKANMIKNPADGLTSVKKSFFFEKAMEDLDPIYYMSYSGCMVNSFTFSAQASSILTGSIEFMGKTSTIYDDGTGGSGSGSLSPDGTKLSQAGENIMNAVADIKGIRLNGVDVNVLGGGESGVYFQGLDFTVANNLRGVQAIGQVGNVSVSPGQLAVTGNMNAFFQDDTMYQHFVDGDEFTLSYEVVDANGEGFCFFFPRITVATSTMSAGGNDQDLIENMTWSALMDKTSKTSVQIHRFYTDYNDAPTVPTITTDGTI